MSNEKLAARSYLSHTHTHPSQEDKEVRKLVEKHGDKSWVLVASFLPNRTGKQIRERWHNQLDPNIMKVRLYVCVCMHV